MTTTTTTPPGAAAPTKQLTRPQEQRLTLRRLFDQQKPELSKLMPRGMDAERIFRMALTECVKNPKLLECTAESWALALQVCAAQGLYPDSGLGYMYLIPRNNSKKRGDTWVKVMEVTAQRGYQGDIQLARNTGEVEDIWAEVVYEKDEYKVVKGLARNIIHVPYDGDDDPGKLRACYGVAKLKSGETPWVTLTRRDVDRHKQSAMDADNAKSPWKLHEAAMWKKTAIHELSKWLPKSSENSERIARAIATDSDPRAAQVIETTAIDLGRVELPAGEEPKAGLDALTDRLTESEGVGASTEEPPKGCQHEKTREYLAGRPVGTVAVCAECGLELRRRERDPGDEDDAPVEVVEPPDEDPKKEIQALAGKAGDTSKPRQGRLSEK